MPKSKRATVYLRPEIHRALKVRSALTDRSISDLVDEAVSEALREDAMDIAIIRKRAGERSRPFEEFLRELKRARRL